MAQKRTARKTPTSSPVAIWLDYQIPSANTFRYQHWTKVRKLNEEAKVAWARSALKLSRSEADTLIQIISSVARNHSEMLSQEAFNWTTATNVFGGNTTPSAPKAQPEHKS